MIEMILTQKNVDRLVAEVGLATMIRLNHTPSCIGHDAVSVIRWETTRYIAGFNSEEQRTMFLIRYG